jgi:hypothetical protein
MKNGRRALHDDETGALKMVDQSLRHDPRHDLTCASRTFRSLAEAKCDHAHGVAPLSPPAEDQSDE